MPKKIADTKKMTHERWLQLRKSSIGGSEAGICNGTNSYSSLIRLYSEKKGLVKEKDTTEAMRRGTDLEPYVAERFMEATGKKVRNDFAMYADEEYPFLTANLDRRVVGENAGLECKFTGGFNGIDYDAGYYPAQYYAQCQHYISVMGFDKMYLAIYNTASSQGIYVFDVERNDEYIADLRAKEVDFWLNYVCKDRMPDADGTESSIETLKELYPQAAPESEITIAGLDKMIEDYKEFGRLAKEFEEKQAEVKARICSKLGKNEVGIGIQYGCSWKSQSRPGIDTKRLKEERPEIYQKYSKVSHTRTFRVKTLKK